MPTNDHQATEANYQVSAEQAREAISTLIDAFANLTNSGEVNVQATRQDLFTSVFGWWAWITNSSKLILLAHDNGLGHEASPNVRSVLEHAVVMQWVIDDEEAATTAIAAKAADDRRKLFDEATKQNWTIPEDITRPAPTQQTMLDFASLCGRYNAKNYYIPYRLLSAHAHPTAKGAEAYLDPDDLHLRSYVDKPAKPDLVLLAICLIQAAQAIDSLTSDQPLAAAITQANTHFGHSIKPLTRT